jgi:minor histocompatibility antigen H13
VYFALINKLDFVGLLLQAYFSFLGVLILKKYLYPYAQSNQALSSFDYKLNLLENSRFAFMRMSLLELGVTLLCVYFVYVYLQTKYWVANNVIALAFTIHSIEHWLVGNFRYILLIFFGLIAYDVYFVFASEVMMTVATGIDLPIKLLMPAGGGQLAILGLGDIVIPGLLSSMCIRCDLINAFKLGREKAIKDGVKDDEERVQTYIAKEMTCYYFYQSLAAYFVGMVATYGALSYLKQA